LRFGLDHTKTFKNNTPNEIFRFPDEIAFLRLQNVPVLWSRVEFNTSYFPFLSCTNPLRVLCHIHYRFVAGTCFASRIFSYPLARELQQHPTRTAQQSRRPRQDQQRGASCLIFWLLQALHFPLFGTTFSIAMTYRSHL
jgi:hypothetical protein